MTRSNRKKLFRVAGTQTQKVWEFLKSQPDVVFHFRDIMDQIGGHPVSLNGSLARMAKDPERYCIVRVGAGKYRYDSTVAKRAGQVQKVQDRKEAVKAIGDRIFETVYVIDGEKLLIRDDEGVLYVATLTVVVGQ